MISRPILTKQIKYNTRVYNLELWSPAPDDMLNSFDMPPVTRKDFFNEVGVRSSRYTDQDTGITQERFDDWFDKLHVSDQRKYAEAIDESNRVIIAIVWDLLLTQDKIELFSANIRSFSRWFSGLDVGDVDFFMTRIMDKQRLMPATSTLPGNEEEEVTEEQIACILGDLYDSIDDDLIRATTINGLLCISCSCESRLQKAKQHMVRHGSILRDFRKKQNAHGNVIYTYIFSRP